MRAAVVLLKRLINQCYLATSFIGSNQGLYNTCMALMRYTTRVGSCWVSEWRRVYHVMAVPTFTTHLKIGCNK